MTPHQTVLLDELVNALALKAGDIAIDCTVGGAGHTEKMLQAVGPKGLILGFDRDERALGLARERLAGPLATGCLRLIKGPFSSLGQVVDAAGLTGKIAGVCADIGVSSMHLDEVERGFSFQNDAPLDMRMDQEGGQTAAELLADIELDALTQLLREYGEEPKARQIAKRIVHTRDETPITTTAQLAALVKAAAAYPTASRKHPATRTFQALRIAVNDELGELQSMLDSGFSVLKPHGRFAIISFHSLEDRLVKHGFLALTGRRERADIPRDIPLREVDVVQLMQVRGQIIKPFPMLPSEAQIRANPRARSAKLRTIEKI
ncbi:MAG: 16S rRNA (cytosine(1402)-N(4))-methyltransferase RsmH [Proteobacteria bacterium]|nr:16S rRNA (cytosine(1402)-N(4))-methyltransferase RsmH [Pseudomonadota bacterium]